jgi:hypothetical protein
VLDIGLTAHALRDRTFGCAGAPGIDREVLLNDAILFLKTYLLSEGIKKCPKWFKSLCDKSGTDAQSGSFEELAMPLFDQFYNFAHWLTREGSEAEDVVQRPVPKPLRGILMRFRNEPGVQRTPSVYVAASERSISRL